RADTESRLRREAKCRASSSLTPEKTCRPLPESRAASPSPSPPPRNPLHFFFHRFVVATSLPISIAVSPSPEHVAITVSYGAFTTSKILDFLDYNKFPLVTKLTEMNSISVYSSLIKLQVAIIFSFNLKLDFHLVFVFADIDDFKDLQDTIQDVARTFKSKIMFIYVDICDRSLLDTVGCKQHRDLTREAIRKSLVLLKNGKDISKPFLPLDRKAKRILVAGTHANDLGF
ncbi:hypothetical protein HN51_008697, partial [Arachis hypogaea]